MRKPSRTALRHLLADAGKLALSAGLPSMLRGGARATLTLRIRTMSLRCAGKGNQHYAALQHNNQTGPLACARSKVLCLPWRLWAVSLRLGGYFAAPNVATIGSLSRGAPRVPARRTGAEAQVLLLGRLEFR